MVAKVFHPYGLSQPLSESKQCLDISASNVHLFLAKKLLLLPPLLSYLIESVHYVKCFWDADVARRELSSLPKKQTAANLFSFD